MAHEFTLVLGRHPSDEEIDELFDAGCDDATPETTAADGLALLRFDRDADTLAGALLSALRQVETVGLPVAAVQSDDLVTLREIASRTGRTYESVRLLASGKRGPGGFPPPLAAEGWALYSWSAVGPWFARHYPSVELDRQRLSTEYDRVIAAADHLVRARALLRDDQDLAAALAKLVAV